MPYGQGIDISYAADVEMSEVQGCTVRGGQEGIVTHSAHAMLRENRVSGTALRGISMTEMSMGQIQDNEVADAVGVGILCGDHSECEIRGNRVADIRPDPASADPSRHGVGILAHYGAHAVVGPNWVTRSPGGLAALLDGRIRID